ncbi:MAG TPA: hypothetical protein PK147_11970, partial [Saprospiraceae bacterium]|nr:hypothetical protein [Saprospiraceae bacterium]
GLGPSFRNVDLNKIDGDTIVVNNFYKIGINFSHFIPSYYLIADKGFATPYHINDLMEALKLYIGKRTKFLLNSALYASEAFIGYPEDQLFYMSNFKGLFNHKKSIIINRINPAFGNVACVAIGYAIALGYKKIVLLGCDFNSFAHTTQAHCYNDASHKRRISMDFELFNYSFDAKIHIELAQYAERIGVEIVNSTKGSLIDAYPVKIDETLYFND